MVINGHIARFMNLGAHMSVAGGLYKSCIRGREATCNVIQIFTKNQQQWKSPPITEEDIALFKISRIENKISTVFAHDSYLINLATSEKPLWEKSISAFLSEMKVAEHLGLAYLITHPGSPRAAGEKVGIKNMAKAINQLHKATKNFKLQILLETTAGQGSTIGYRFEQLSGIIELLHNSERIGICLDTCHVFAAGYDISNKHGYEKTFDAFDRIIGLKKLKAFHLNDSKKELNSRVDRHEHIGKGAIGLEAFRLIMNDVRFTKIPMVLETPKEDNMDIVNLRLLRRFRKK